MTTYDQATHRIDRLLDAIDMVKDDQREEARALLRELIGEDSNFEDAWLWMSVAVDSLDQSSVCLDNVLRVNPYNHYAAGALYRIREPEIKMQRVRSRLLFVRDSAYTLMWVIIAGIIIAVMFLYTTLPLS